MLEMESIFILKEQLILVIGYYLFGYTFRSGQDELKLPYVCDTPFSARIRHMKLNIEKKKSFNNGGCRKKIYSKVIYDDLSTYKNTRKNCDQHS